MINLFNTACSKVEIAAVADVLSGGKLILGNNVTALESELATYLGVDSVVTCASGTDALVLTLEWVKRHQNKPGAEVIVPAMTFSATYEAVLKAGMKPVVVDVDHLTLSPRISDYSSAINDRTVAAIVVHLHGWPYEGARILRRLCVAHGMLLIEDCAQAFGADLGEDKVGTIGHAAAFSFYPTKPLGGIADGGAVAFQSETATIRARAIRNHGRTTDGQAIAGYNSRLDETNAAVLRIRLAKYPKTLERIRNIAGRYESGIKRIESYAVEHARWSLPAPYVYPLSVPKRNELMRLLLDAGVETRPHYDPALSGLPYVTDKCPSADYAASKILSLPCHSDLTAENIEFICDSVNSCLRKFGI